MEINCYKEQKNLCIGLIPVNTCVTWKIDWGSWKVTGLIKCSLSGLCPVLTFRIFINKEEN